MKVIIKCPNANGYYETPNGCYYFYRTAKVKDVDVATRKYVLGKVSELKDSCEDGDPSLDDDTVRSFYDTNIKEEVKNYKTVLKKMDVSVNYPPPKGSGLLLNGSPD